MAKHRDAAKERFWRRSLQQWQRSRLTIRAFCALHELAEHNFHAWRRKLACRDHEVSGDSETASFVPVVVAPDLVADEPAAIEVVLGNGRRLRVNRGFDAPTLAQVVAVLEEGRPC